MHLFRKVFLTVFEIKTSLPNLVTPENRIINKIVVLSIFVPIRFDIYDRDNVAVEIDNSTEQICNVQHALMLYGI